MFSPSIWVISLDTNVLHVRLNILQSMLIIVTIKDFTKISFYHLIASQSWRTEESFRVQYTITFNHKDLCVIKPMFQIGLTVTLRLRWPSLTPGAGSVWPAAGRLTPGPGCGSTWRRPMWWPAATHASCVTRSVHPRMHTKHTSPDIINHSYELNKKYTLSRYICLHSNFFSVG